MYELLKDQHEMYALDQSSITCYSKISGQV